MEISKMSIPKNLKINMELARQHLSRIVPVIQRPSGYIEKDFIYICHKENTNSLICQYCKDDVSALSLDKKWKHMRNACGPST